MTAVTADFLAELVEDTPNTRGMYRDIIREFDKDTDAMFVDVSLMPFAKGKSVNNLKQSFLNNLPPKSEKAPAHWSKIVVRTPDVTLEDGTVERHVYLLHIDRVLAAKVAAAAEAAAKNDE